MSDYCQCCGQEIVLSDMAIQAGFTVEEIGTASELDPVPLSGLTFKTLEIEDRPSGTPLEDGDAIMEMLAGSAAEEVSLNECEWCGHAAGDHYPNCHMPYEAVEQERDELQVVVESLVSWYDDDQANEHELDLIVMRARAALKKADQ